MKQLTIIFIIILFASCEKNIIEPEIIKPETGFVVDSVKHNNLFPGYYWMYTDSIPFQYWDLIRSGSENIYVGIVVAIYPNYFVTQKYYGNGTLHNNSIFIHIGSVGNPKRTYPSYLTTSNK